MNNRSAIIKKIGLALFKDKKILMARYKGSSVFYFVGGQVREGEMDIACLARKVPDEIGVSLDIEMVKFLGEFIAKADDRENTNITLRLYEGKVLGEPTPTHDVEELRYFDSTDDPRLLSAIAVDKVFPWLVTHGYIY